jgi:DNA-directed RNA polymerase alpha subunit
MTKEIAYVMVPYEEYQQLLELKKAFSGYSPEDNIFYKSVNDLFLSCRARMVLQDQGIKFLGGIAVKEKKEFAQLMGVGTSTLGELSEALEQHGLHFGMKIKDHVAQRIKELSN